MNLLLIIMACLAGMAAGAAVAWLWWRGQWARRESAWQTSLAQQEERQRTAQERLSEQQAALAQAEARQSAWLAQLDALRSERRPLLRLQEPAAHLPRSCRAVGGHPQLRDRGRARRRAAWLLRKGDFAQKEGAPCAKSSFRFRWRSA